MEDVSFVVGKLIRYDEDEIYKPPDTASAQGDEHKNTCTDFACVEAVYSKLAEEDAQEKCDEPTIVGVLHRT